ncbi:von Willebrand factor A domain-containing protein 7-like [Epinephelus moara]|uniref:von Willebrand factor A domain-containing protein 7-like n=1 Tax=Epinephelus moara TaxID=300413 RepID=UPI00214F48E4|nr:von Willebrand factor A domain-containing protein 7-like [Epinephelus moara]
MFGLAALCFLLLQTGASGFGLSSGESLSHQEITKRAILNTTAQTCRALALAEGKDFTFPSLTVDAVAAACEAPSKSFLQTIQLIQTKNKRVDYFLFFLARYHMDDEQILEGRKIITDGLAAVKASNREQNFEAAREILGQILHPLQDFYSHSNWVEMGNKLPNSNLIRSDTSVGNIAAESRATCRNCNGDDCTNNILEDILQERIITSGYFNFVPFFSSKPKGKCSHGGFLDRTSNIVPIGGINKDTLDSSHGHLHMEAANVAIAATSEFLEDIRGAAGDKPFLQMMGISRGSGKPLCFMIDTTGSMSDDIAAVRTVTSDIIDRRVGTQDEPSVYILVPFNDPDFGPLTRTTDPEVFRNAINSLTATGGGDPPEMSLSGLQLALTSAPPSSEIFLFTDAAAKDAHLRSTVTALIEQTKTVVNFMITAVLGFRHRRQSDDSLQQQQPISRMARSDAQLYRDLAQASGGLAIEVSKSELLEATSIITQTSSSSLVTDITKPVCELLNLQSNCSDNCVLSMWEISVQVTDGANGTGVDRITLRQGNGTLNTSLATDNENITLVSYSASCCSPAVELVVVDRYVVLTYRSIFAVVDVGCDFKIASGVATLPSMSEERDPGAHPQLLFKSPGRGMLSLAPRPSPEGHRGHHLQWD